MEKRDLVGYRFHPTGEELINHYLKNKILDKPWLVNEAMTEVNICDYEPDHLPSLAKIQSDDPVWYFFSPKEYTSAKKKVTKRTTVNGFWKATGVDRKIKDKRGSRGDIGIKKTLVYYLGRVPNGVWTPWVMHEYHITSLPITQRNYVICQVMYKGEDGDIPFSSGGNTNNNNSSGPSQSGVSVSNTVKPVINTPPQVEQPGFENYVSVNDLLAPINQQEGLAPWDVLDPDMLFSGYNNTSTVQSHTPYFPQDDNEFLSGLKHVNRGQVEHLFSDDDDFIMQQDYNNYRPPKSLSGIVVDHGTDIDNDAESISETSYQGTSSPGERDGSPDKCFPSSVEETLYYPRNNVQTSAKPSKNRKARESQLTRHTIPSKQEVKGGRFKAVNRSIKSSMVKTEKKGLFIMEKGPENPQYIYLMNMIIGFILLLALICDIISALVTIKA